MNVMMLLMFKKNTGTFLYHFKKTATTEKSSEKTN